MIILFFLISCKIKFNDEEIDWLAYDINDTVSFICSSNIDTFIITNKYLLNTGWKPIEIDRPSSGIYNPIKGSLWIYSNKFRSPINNMSPEKEFISIYKSNPQESLSVTISFSNFNTWFQTDTLKINFDSIRINNKYYYDVFCFFRQIEPYELEKNDIICIYWNKNFGLLRYDENNGQKWELIQ